MEADFCLGSSRESVKCFLKVSINDMGLKTLREGFVDSEKLLYNSKEYVLDILHLENFHALYHWTLDLFYSHVTIILYRF